MPESRLALRSAETLGEAVVSAELALASDIVRHCVATLGLIDPSEREAQVLRAAVLGQTGWSESRVQALVELGLRPELRGALSDTERTVFSARFGTEAAVDLEVQDDGLDLHSFGLRYGPPQALQLLDTLFAVAVAESGLDARVYSRLEAAGRELGVDGVPIAALLSKHQPRLRTGEHRYRLHGERVSIGRSVACDLVLADPQVSRAHAEILAHEGGWRVVDQGSGRPTVLNSAAVSEAPLTEGDQLRIGPYLLRLEAGEIVVMCERQSAALSIQHLSRSIEGVQLLDDLSFTVFAGEVVAVVGPSGCGKTTLLNAISGVAPADSGEVRLEGRDFHAQLGIDRSLVGIVPQDDLVSPELSVEESLQYSGRLRFSADVSPQQLQTQVDRVIDELELGDIRHSRVGDTLRRGISGGQRKRVNLGQELMSKSTRVLFLDEPTSGLDPQTSQDIGRRVRQLADRGRIVFVVTHDLTPKILAQVDHLVVLAPGGRLAFFGPPAEACEWFGVRTPDAIFARLGYRSPDEWAAHYRGGPVARKYVQTREHSLAIEGIAPELAEERRPLEQSGLKQLTTLLSRYWRIKLRDRPGLFVLGLQPPVLAAVMWVVFEEPTPSLMFMLALSSLWFGMSAAVRELITDRVIWRREHRAGVGVLPYIGSKVGVLGALVALQSVALAGLMYGVLDMGSYGTQLLPLLGVSALIGWVGMSLGLLVSSIWTSSEAAVGTLPLLLIPQITLSSIMVSMRSMGDLAQALSWITVQRYAFDAVLKCTDELAYFKYGRWQRQGVEGFLYELGLKTSSKAGDQGLPLELLVGAMSGMAVLCLGGAVLRVWMRER